MDTIIVSDDKQTVRVTKEAPTMIMIPKDMTVADYVAELQRQKQVYIRILAKANENLQQLKDQGVIID